MPHTLKNKIDYVSFWKQWKPYMGNESTGIDWLMRCWDISLHRLNVACMMILSLLRCFWLPCLRDMITLHKVTSCVLHKIKHFVSNLQLNVFRCTDINIMIWCWAASDAQKCIANDRWTLWPTMANCWYDITVTTLFTLCLVHVKVHQWDKGICNFYS